MLEMKTLTSPAGTCKSVASRSTRIEEGRAIFDAADAQYILERMNYARQRRLSKPHIQVLAMQMQTQGWTQGTQIAFVRTPDRRLTLVDGQHRLAALIEANTVHEFQVLVIDVKSEEELHATYYRFDTVRRTRSKEMVLNAVGIAETHGLLRGTAMAAYEAVVIIGCGMRRLQGSTVPATLRTPDGKLAAIEPFWPAIKEYNACILNADKTMKHRLWIGSVMAVALLTIRDQPEMALKFWRDVAMNDGLRVGQPERALVQVLLKKDFGASKFDAAIRVSANAWNARFKNISVNYLRGEAIGGIRILGCKIPACVT